MSDIMTRSGLLQAKVMPRGRKVLTSQVQQVVKSWVSRMAFGLTTASAPEDKQAKLVIEGLTITVPI